MTDLIPIIEAISLLNPHARAFGFGRKAIYAYKDLVARMHALSGDIEVKPVAVMAKCRGCDGTGLFIDWYDGPTNERCRKCARTGYVHLRFVETTIGGHVWHHPWEHNGADIFRMALGFPEIGYRNRVLTVTRAGCEPEEIQFGSLGDWKPNTPGERLPPERAAELLNIAEEWLSGLDGLHPLLRWPYERAITESRHYNISIGRTGTSCHYCGFEPVTSGQHRLVKPLEWTVPCCKAHEGMPLEKWDSTVPARAITPAVQRWLDRRQACEAA